MRISKAAFDSIVAEEVSSEAVYRKKYQRPEWPGFASGVTIGIGFDCGYATEKSLYAAWTGLIPQAMIEKLSNACGVTGDQARHLCAELRADVVVPWEAAISEFEHHEVPRWEKLVDNTLPNTDKLSPDSFGALVSLAYNRGTSFAKNGDRYAEMRAIKSAMKREDFDEIPDLFRSMKRLWPNSGLVKRREREAKLFERGLRAPAPKPVPAPKPKAPPTKPLAKSKTFWASVVAAVTTASSQLFEALSDWRVWTAIIVVLLLAYVAWERSGKPDIKGLFR